MRNWSLYFVITLTLMLWTGCGDEKPKEEEKAPLEQPEQPAVVDTTVPVVVPKEKEKTPSTTSPTRPAIEKNVTIIGEVIDIVSYATSGVRADSPTGKEIIQASANGGNPLGLLEKGTGKVYIVTMKQANTSANASLLQYLGITVAAKGDAFRKGDQQLLVMSVIGKSIK